MENLQGPVPVKARFSIKTTNHVVCAAKCLENKSVVTLLHI